MVIGDHELDLQVGRPTEVQSQRSHGSVRCEAEVGGTDEPTPLLV
jgi:hypothetical protein